MPIKKYLNRVEQFDQLIRLQSTGTPEEMACRLGMSKRSFHDFKNELIEDFNMPIAYCSFKKTYFYKEKGKLVLLFFEKSEEDM